MTQFNEGSFMCKLPLDGEDRFAYFHFPRALHGDEIVRLLEFVDSLVVREESERLAHSTGTDAS